MIKWFCELVNKLKQCRLIYFKERKITFANTNFAKTFLIHFRSSSKNMNFAQFGRVSEGKDKLRKINKMQQHAHVRKFEMQ